MKACDKKLNRKRSVADAETPQITKFFTVLECYICHKSIWKYNLPLHMAEQHVGVDVLDADIVSEEEKSFFSKK